MPLSLPLPDPDDAAADPVADTPDNPDTGLMARMQTMEVRMKELTRNMSLLHIQLSLLGDAHNTLVDTTMAHVNDQTKHLP